MSLLLQAAEFRPELNEEKSAVPKPGGGISRVMNRIARRKSTPKRPPSESDPYRVSKSMANLSPVDDSDDAVLGNFKPLPPPAIRQPNTVHADAGDGGFAHNTSFGFPGELDDAYATDMRFRGTVDSTTTKPIAPPSNDTMKKLDYIIHMIEEQRDHKTGRVAEELVLYSFLGVFVIFTIDSFVKVGRYTR
jgi:hypothetical protein